MPIVGNLSDVEVDLEKVVKLRGFSGLHPVVSSFTFANSSTATDVIADVVVTIDNPTVFTFDPIGELSLDVKAGKSMVGNASTPVWSLFPGKNVGMRVKAHVFGTGLWFRGAYVSATLMVDSQMRTTRFFKQLWVNLFMDETSNSVHHLSRHHYRYITPHLPIRR